MTCTGCATDVLLCTFVAELLAAMSCWSCQCRTWNGGCEDAFQVNNCLLSQCAPLRDISWSAHGLYSSVAERQSCKLKVLGSIPSGGYFPPGQACLPNPAACMWMHRQGFLPLIAAAPPFASTTQVDAIRKRKVDPLGFEPRAFRMRSGCDTTTP